MKHNVPVIVWMASFFLIAQFIGLAVLYQYIDVQASMRAGRTQFRGMELGGAPIERPQVGETSSVAYIMVALLIGTALMLVLMRFNVTWLWKAWFGLAVVICLGLALAAFLPSTIALLAALVVGAWKILRPNWWVQTFTELVMYSGLAVIFVPVMNLTAAILLLVFISAYDAYAVWRSGHMIALAKFQAGAKMFAGLVIPYQDGRIRTVIPKSIGPGKAPEGKPPEKSAVQRSSPAAARVARVSKMVSGPSPIRTAILGGGDIGFPLLFAGVVLKSWGLIPALVIPFAATVALLVLFLKGNDGKFYPAMPFLSAGCLAGLAIAYVL